MLLGAGFRLERSWTWTSVSSPTFFSTRERHTAVSSFKWFSPAKIPSRTIGSRWSQLSSSAWSSWALPRDLEKLTEEQQLSHLCVNWKPMLIICMFRHPQIYHKCFAKWWWSMQVAPLTWHEHNVHRKAILCLWAWSLSAQKGLEPLAHVWQGLLWGGGGGGVVEQGTQACHCAKDFLDTHRRICCLNGGKL